jgi:hypothetical protein
MKKLNLSIDLLKLEGAKKITREGRDFVVLEISKSRTKPHQNGAVYLNLEAIERNAGADQYGNTHFVCEPTTKDERESGLKLPILGNGKEFDLNARRPAPQQQTQRQAAPAREESAGSFSDAMEDDDIPF